MDAHHQQQLQRILENRRKRGASSAPVHENAAPPAPAAPVATGVSAVPPPQPAPVVQESAGPLTSYPVSPAEERPPVVERRMTPLESSQPQVEQSFAQERAQPQSRSASVMSATPARTFMTVNFNNNQAEPRLPQEAPGGPNTSIYGTLNTHRDAFSDFRNHPVGPISVERLNPHFHHAQRATQFAKPVVQQNMMRAAVVEPRVTQSNPFRTQTYEKFVEAPSYAAPPEMSALSPDPHMGDRSGQGLDVVEYDAKRQDGTEIFDIRQSIDDMKQGDWFLKWTRKKDKMHRRYFWLDVERGSLYWAKSPGTLIYLCSSIKIEEIAEIQTSCVVDEASGKTVYILVIVCVSRALQIGTELRDKFDKWHDALERLSVSQRQYNSRFYGRYTTAPPKKNQLEKHIQQQQFAANPMD